MKRLKGAPAGFTISLSFSLDVYALLLLLNGPVSERPSLPNVTLWVTARRLPNQSGEAAIHDGFWPNEFPEKYATRPNPLSSCRFFVVEAGLRLVFGQRDEECVRSMVIN